MTESLAAVIALIVFTLIHVVLGAMQAALAAGAPLGRFAWGGNHRVLPASLRTASIVTIFVYALFVLIALEKAGATALLPAMFADVGIWILAAYFLVGLVMNSISRSKAERLTMAPCCLLLAMSSVILALS
jgi:hypothetical protein